MNTYDFGITGSHAGFCNQQATATAATEEEAVVKMLKTQAVAFWEDGYGWCDRAVEVLSVQPVRQDGKDYYSVVFQPTKHRQTSTLVRRYGVLPPRI